MKRKLPVCLTILALLAAGCGGQTAADAAATPVDSTQTLPSIPLVLTPPSTPPAGNGAAPSTPPAAAGTGVAGENGAAVDCSAPAAALPELTEGPYYKAGSPEDANLADSLPGVRLVLTGYVLDTACQPIANAWLDFWQADSSGAYDNSGYTLRGHQYTDANGAYRLETVVPGLYPGRTEHIHFKIRAVEGGPVVTSQLFFPGVSQNEGDGIFNAALLIHVLSESKTEMTASYTFVVER